ncbi:MAG: hypothetical protein VCC01_04315 [Candidatus Hydrogenedentota bacterium]|jgi:hypothetical protein
MRYKVWVQIESIDDDADTCENAIVVEDLEICKCEGENSCFGPEFVL